MLPAHPSTLSSRYFGDNPSENSFVGELVTPGSHWTSVLNNVSFSFKISVQGFAEQALPGLKSTATWPSMVEVRPSGKDSFFLPVPTGDRGESSVFDLAVGEKEANVGLSGSGLGMSRIKWARLDVNLLWKDLGDKELVDCWRAGFTGPFSFTSGLFFSVSPEAFSSVFSGTWRLISPSVNVSTESSRHRFSPTDMLRDILAMKLVVRFM